MTEKRYTPNKKTIALRESMYTSIDAMIEVKNQNYPQFNSEDGRRNLLQYVEDSDRRLNGDTLTREEQGKEDWQANTFDPITRIKLKAVVAGVALQVPELAYKVVNKDGMFSSKRAELIKQLVRYSRLNGNPQTDIFFEAWECAGRGTVIKFDGYLKTKYKRKFIKSYDLSTGAVEFDEREEIVDDKPIDIQIPIEEFFWSDMFVRDVQDQSSVAWIKNYTKAEIEQEFGQYPNFKYVKDGGSIKKYHSDTNSYYYDKWSKRVKDEDDYEVIRFFNMFEDRYEIWINGVDILIAPILWGRTKKLYPFSKTIFEPFSSKAFFVGKSLPSVLEGNQDVNNTIWNSTLDKLYRSLTKPLLVGLANKDLLDVEDELVNQDNKIYVPDVSQVKPIPFEGVSAGDMAMLQAVATKLDMSSSDANQQGVQGKGVTAREAIIADENARKMKGVFFMFLEDLWIQKTKIRIPNILMNVMQPKMEAIIGKDGKEVMQEALKILSIPDTDFSDGTKGTLGVQVAGSENTMFDQTEIEAREETMNTEGVNYKLISTTSDYLDDWDIDFQIVSQSLFNQDNIRKDEEIMGKLERIATYFPERFMSNKDKLFDELVDLYGETSEEYKEAVEVPQEGEEQNSDLPIEGEPTETLPAGSPLEQGERLLTKK